ncbi:MAG: mycolipenoyl-CoA---2-(long-chain-fatty acyl)-trehalose mycolipenoyltransferase, partial [Mycobacterium sp.]|nr:mycolipenoyl-CoA---2-(long-chain-fatty acyl)-trehalose mycolipenoyltransferase [Mycobacterium sp.]
LFRYEDGLAMEVMLPDNPIAHKSVTRYMEAMRSVCGRVANTGNWGRFV